MMSQPAASSRWICATVAATSSVRVLHMDWMGMGAPPPTGTPPMLICFVIQSPFIPYRKVISLYANSLTISLKATTTISRIRQQNPAIFT